ncbi:S8 family serine peptidase [Streptomyces sp. VRA16 Mangrove soil]|uniref:S8 family serine peptidase n=1 Tax=Streptomyces sp. VRA16 Mangrove soil TaxID=2817434 RepID=UPI001A9ECEBB|nr:S8 family serine peptidase [Streptomyces sp. VRA16 Mangrove soil]MBO1336862.1 S8 family serine peptidase [Streptomyces sp. VRA16 Mangrove soil]
MTRGPAARHSRRGAALLSAGLAFALLPAGGSHAATAAPSTKAASAAHTVTLVTGDKVTVTDLGGGHRTVTVERAKGATGAVRTQVSDGDITVVPDEARPYLAAGTLDKRLFDVSELIRQGLADAKADATPLIVTYDGKRARTAAALPKGAERTRALPSIGGAAVDADKGRTFWKGVTSASGTGLGDGLGKVWLDARVTADMAESNAQIGTPKAWEAGLTGKGVKVAVLDSGYDTTHPDLASRVTESKSFIEGQDVADANGHGTHVTSTVGGSGAASDGKEKGVAPDATLAVGKVLSNEGSGTESQIIAGMEWAAKDIKAKIVSMSLGSDVASDGTDPMAAAVNSLSQETGALFVVAAGNYGAPGTIGSPGAADAALTVGAVDADDQAAYFTSQGPRIGDNALKPDVSAPGVDILAARSSLVSGEGAYTTMSGTSMATPHVAGVAALLAQEHPDWTGAQLKDALMSSSKELDASAYALGAGRVSVPDAVGADITATGSADLGFYKWPYSGNGPVTRTVTYSNSSDSAVELSLAVTGAPDGVATLKDSTLTVPAHGTASTTVTGDGAKAAVGNTSGRITASAAGKEVAHTAFGMVKEDERYTLTVHVKDRDGAPSGAFIAVQQLAAGVDPQGYEVGDDGTVELRLKPGTYYVDSFLNVRGSHGKDSLGLGYLADPEVKLDQDRDITLDGRQLREVAADVGRTAETRQLIMEADRKANGAEITNAVQLPVAYDSVFAAPTRKVSEGSYVYRTVWRLGKPMLQVDGVRDTLVQAGGTLIEGRSRLGVVDAGTGAPADYTGKNVRGKAVLVHADGATPPAGIAQAAQDAGARALFVTDTTAGRLNTYFGTDDNTDRPLQIATVDAQGAAVLAAAAKDGRTVGMTGTRYTPWVYDLTDQHKGSIPRSDLTYEPDDRELAVLDTKFHAVKPQPGAEFRYSLTDTFTVGLGFLESVAYPAERTDYVSTGAGLQWMESVQAGPTDWEQRSGLISYKGGTHKELDWFKPVWHPWLGTGLGWGQQRSGNTLQFNTPGWGDSGPDHTGFGDAYSETSGMQQFTTVYVDGTEADRNVSSGAYVWDADPAEHTYKVATDTQLDGDRWGLATKGHSEWTFKSAATPDDQWTTLPLINLGFDVDTDLKGTVRAGARLPVGLFAAYVAGAADTGTLGGGELEVSYDDGATWKTVALKGEDASWKGELNVPGDARYVSLRASASDDEGGSVSQEIVRAVAVRR